MNKHEWCRDTVRDEAVRAAEDAAAVPSIQHRDLPEQVALLWASVGDIIGRVVRLEGEMDAGQDEEAAPAVCDSASPAEGLRTERVTPPWQRAKWDEALAIICNGGDWGRGNNFDHGVLGALVIWADKEMDRLPAERDAALRERDAAKEECERLRGRLATLEPIAKAHEDAIKAAEKFNAEQMGKAITNRMTAYSLVDAMAHGLHAGTKAVMQPIMHALIDQRDAYKARVAELEGAAAANAGGEQQPPRGWMTAEDRDWIAGLTDDDDFTEEGKNIAKALLARSTPPRVKGPTGWAYDAHDMAWIAAIRAAGGEVE